MGITDRFRPSRPPRGSHVAIWVMIPGQRSGSGILFNSTRLYPHYVSYLDVQEQTPQFTILDL